MHERRALRDQFARHGGVGGVVRTADAPSETVLFERQLRDFETLQAHFLPRRQRNALSRAAYLRFLFHYTRQALRKRKSRQELQIHCAGRGGRFLKASFSLPPRTVLP